ncbi:MAG TPA: hypothetical protein VMF86_18000 [Stellaceae bacterium]|nr:hypothetical protein [Stellaceae bacterium]
MASAAWSEVRLALGGALRLAIGDRRGLRCFDASIDGFWRSFRAAAICYPLYLFLLALRISHAQWQQSGVATILVVETIDYVVSWVIFPLVILPLCGWLRRDDRFLAFMVAYNWSQVPQTALFAVIGIDGLTGLLSPGSLPGAEFVAALATMVYEWYIARVALAVGAAPAVLIVVIDLLLGTTLARLAEALY